MVRGDITVILILIVGLISTCFSEVKTDGPPIIHVEWHIPKEFRHGVPSSLCFTICNEGGDAEGENNLWITGYQIGLAQWTLDRGACFLTGWQDDFRLQDKYVTEGFVELRFYVKMWNDFGYDTYDETKKVPVYEVEPENPCEGIECKPECYGCDLWARKCVNGECVQDYLIEENSNRCDSDCDPCEKDSDNDGVNDCEDYCHNPGCSIVDSNGCPRDTDGDGISDCDDHCAYEPGPASNGGCPADSSTCPPRSSIIPSWFILIVILVLLIIVIVTYRGKEPEYPEEDIHTDKNQEVRRR